MCPSVGIAYTISKKGETYVRIGVPYEALRINWHSSCIYKIITELNA